MNAPTFSLMVFPLSHFFLACLSVRVEVKLIKVFLLIKVLLLINWFWNVHAPPCYAQAAVKFANVMRFLSID